MNFLSLRGKLKIYTGESEITVGALGAPGYNFKYIKYKGESTLCASEQVIVM